MQNQSQRVKARSLQFLSQVVPESLVNFDLLDIEEPPVSQPDADHLKQHNNNLQDQINDTVVLLFIFELKSIKVDIYGQLYSI